LTLADLALGAADRVVDQVELDLELLALLDLGAVGFQHRLGLGDLAQSRWIAGCRHQAASGTAGHLGADRAQLGHDLAVQRADIDAIRDFSRRQGAGKGFFNTKTLAMNRHEILLPTSPLASLRPTRFNMEFTPGTAVRAHAAATCKALTMRCRRSPKINATRQIRGQLTMW